MIYGTRHFDNLNVVKLFRPANHTFAVNVAGQPDVNNTIVYKTSNSDISTLFRSDGSSYTTDPGSIAFTRDIAANSVVAIQTGSNNNITYVIYSGPEKWKGNSAFSNVEVNNVNNSFVLPAGKTCLIVEGTIDVPSLDGSNTFSANSETDIYAIGARQSDTTLGGSGIVVTFNISS